LPSRAASAIVGITMLAAVVFSAWSNRASISHAASAQPLPGLLSSDSSGQNVPALGVAGQPAPPLFTATSVNVNVQGFVSWALLDRQNGKIPGSGNLGSDTNSTESMIKAWIASDYLRRLGDAQPPPDHLDALTRMIRDSDNDAAESVYQEDGANAVVQRMIDTCDLTDTSVFDGWWSRSEISARDAVRLGLCVADGRAAGPTWTTWILNEMRQVRGEGRFGIIEALPAGAVGRTSIKNGWTIVGDEWRVNCLAIVDRYVLAVLNRYPADLGLGYGAGTCRTITTRLQARG
jgi:hypothetical protein